MAMSREAEYRTWAKQFYADLHTQTYERALFKADFYAATNPLAALAIEDGNSPDVYRQPRRPRESTANLAPGGHGSQRAILRGSIVLRYRRQGLTWRQIGEKLNLGHERVRQLGYRASQRERVLELKANRPGFLWEWTPEIQSFERVMI